VRGPPFGLSLNQFGFYPYIYCFILSFSRRFDSYLTYAFTDMLLSLLLVSRTDRSVDDGLKNTCPILAKYIYQSTFTGAPRSSRIRLIFRPICVLVGFVDVSISPNIQSFLFDNNMGNILNIPMRFGRRLHCTTHYVPGSIAPSAFPPHRKTEIRSS